MISKPELQAMQRPNRLLTVQVWATGMLHTAGYQGELAVIMQKGGRIRNLASMDIAEELYAVAIAHYRGAGIVPSAKEGRKDPWGDIKETRQHIRRALLDLEEDGVCERRSRDGTPLRELTEAQLRRLPSGTGQLYFWAKPRAAKPENVRSEWSERLEKTSQDPNREVAATWLPTSSIQLILKSVCAVTSASALFSVKPTRAEIEDPAYQNRFRNAWEIAAQSFADAWTSTDVAATGLPQNGTAPTATRLPEVAATAPPLYKEERKLKDTTPAAAAKLAASHLEAELEIDAAAAQTLWSNWRKEHPDITPEEAVTLARRKLARNPTVRNPTGLLLHYVPSEIELATARKDAKRFEDQERRDADIRARREQAQNVELATATLNDASASEQDRQWAQEVLGLSAKGATS